MNPVLELRLIWMHTSVPGIGSRTTLKHRSYQAGAMRPNHGESHQGQDKRCDLTWLIDIRALQGGLQQCSSPPRRNSKIGVMHYESAPLLRQEAIGGEADGGFAPVPPGFSALLPLPIGSFCEQMALKDCIIYAEINKNPRTLREPTCMRTGRSPARLGLTTNAGPRWPLAAMRTCTCWRSRTGVLVPVNQPNIFAHIYVSPGAASVSPGAASPVPQLRRYTYLARGWISAEARLGESEREGSLLTRKLAWT